MQSTVNLWKINWYKWHGHKKMHEALSMLKCYNQLNSRRSAISINSHFSFHEIKLNIIIMKIRKIWINLHISRSGIHHQLIGTCKILHELRAHTIPMEINEELWFDILLDAFTWRHLIEFVSDASCISSKHLLRRMCGDGASPSRISNYSSNK